MRDLVTEWLRKHKNLTNILARVGREKLRIHFLRITCKPNPECLLSINFLVIEYQSKSGVFIAILISRFPDRSVLICFRDQKFYFLTNIFCNFCLIFYLNFDLHIIWKSRKAKICEHSIYFQLLNTNLFFKFLDISWTCLKTVIAVLV